MSEPVFRVGDLVCKPKGYRFDGTVVMAGRTLAGLMRYCVDNGQGMLHIFAPEQLALREVEFTEPYKAKEQDTYFQPGDAGRSE